MSRSEEVRVTCDGGTIRFVYDDRLLPLHALGEATVTRASHVEPAPSGGWEARMDPVGGPVLGPFATRAEALTAEREWLREHLGL